MRKISLSTLKELFTVEFLKTIAANHCITNMILVLFLSLAICSCSNDDDQSSKEGSFLEEGQQQLPDREEPRIVNEIPQEIKDLIYFKGNENASEVLINAQAGPDNILDEELVNVITDNFNTTNLLVVNVHQAQTLNPNILFNEDITEDQAIAINTESIEILSKVIGYFKGKGKAVYVLGLSFGAFVTQDLIAKKGIDIADKYLIISGRLDMDEVIWKAALEGKVGEFENGVLPIINPVPEGDIIDRNLVRLSAEFAHNRYTELLNPIEDLSNVTYIFGKTDEAVGSLNIEEVEFLASKNAKILFGNGGHDEPFVGFFEQGLKDTFGIDF